MDDRTGPNGEKILHVAEVQSDWHQAGRTKGYAGQSVENPRLRVVKDIEGGWNVEHVDRHEIVNPRPYGTEDAARDSMQYWESRIAKSDIPDAPFKKTWHELAMKRVLRYAAEHGYDKVTWDTG